MAIFNSLIWNTGIFNTGDDGAVPPVVVVKTGTGGIDPFEARRKRYPPVKPIGILHLPEKKRKPVSPVVEARIDESREIQAEIAARLAREFTEDTQALDQALEFKPIVTMSMAEVEAEIGLLLRKKLRTEEDEILLLLLMVAATV